MRRPSLKTINKRIEASREADRRYEEYKRKITEELIINACLFWDGNKLFQALTPQEKHVVLRESHSYEIAIPVSNLLGVPFAEYTINGLIFAITYPEKGGWFGVHYEENSVTVKNSNWI